MRLHRVRLRNYRGVVDSTVEFATDGVTVVEGDNEVGKSCIPEALDLILCFKDSSKARDVKDVKPADRDEGPEVEIEVAAGHYRFVYRKRWLRSSETTLAITAPRPEQHTGDEAHARVGAMLDETLDSDLWKALRIEQGTELGLPRFDVPSLGEALDRAAANGAREPDDRPPSAGAESDPVTASGAPTASADGRGHRGAGRVEPPSAETAQARGDDLWERVRAERDRYWTTSGLPKKERKDSAESVAATAEEVAELERKLAAIEGDAEQVAKLVADEARLVADREDAERESGELADEWESTQRLRDEVDRAESVRRAAEERRDRVAGEWERRRELVEALSARAEELARLKAEAQKAAPELADAIALSEKAGAALEQARVALRSAEAASRRVNEDRDHHRRQIEVEQLRERHDRVVAAEGARTAAEERIEAARIDDELLARIEEADVAVVRAKAAAGSAAATLEATALADTTVQIGGHDVALTAGDTTSSVVSHEVELVVPDVVALRVRAGAGSRDLAKELDDAEEELARLCREGGVADSREARQQNDERRSAERDRQEAAKTISQDRRDLTVDDLRRKIEGLSGRIASYAGERPADPPLPANHDEARRAASRAEEVVAERRADLERCETAANEAAAARTEAELGEATLGGKIELSRSAAEDAERRLAAEREERPDTDLQAAVVVAQSEVEAAAESLAQAERALKEADPDSLEVRLANARAVAARAAADLQTNKDRRVELEASLKHRGEEGLHAGLGEAESRYRHLLREHESVEARAAAALLLYETFAARRQEAQQRYVAPFKEHIERFGRIVFGATFEIELDDELRLVGRTLDGVTLPVGQLSIGAREQLGVLSRLACAAIVSPDGGGAPVVVDDALGWSDPSRLARMGAAIAAAAPHCQVIVLTCTPGRYAHVGGAKVVPLPG